MVQDSPENLSYKNWSTCASTAFSRTSKGSRLAKQKHFCQSCFFSENESQLNFIRNENTYEINISKYFLSVFQPNIFLRFLFHFYLHGWTVSVLSKIETFHKLCWSCSHLKTKNFNSSSCRRIGYWSAQKYLRLCKN